MLDQMTGGRLDIGIGRGGKAVEYQSFCLDPADSRAMFRESIEVLQRLWSDELFAHHGRFFNVEKTAALSPALVQRPHPPLYVTANSAESLTFAAERDLHFVQLDSLIDDCKRDIEFYRGVAAKAGHAARPRLCLTREVYVAPTDGRRARGEEASARILELWGRFTQFVEAGQIPASFESWYKRAPRLYAMSFDELVESGMVLAGSPEGVARQILRHRAALDLAILSARSSSARCRTTWSRARCGSSASRSCPASPKPRARRRRPSPRPYSRRSTRRARRNPRRDRPKVRTRRSAARARRHGARCGCSAGSELIGQHRLFRDEPVGRAAEQKRRRLDLGKPRPRRCCPRPIGKAPHVRLRVAGDALALVLVRRRRPGRALAIKDAAPSPGGARGGARCAGESGGRGEDEALDQLGMEDREPAADRAAGRLRHHMRLAAARPRDESGQHLDHVSDALAMRRPGCRRSPGARAGARGAARPEAPRSAAPSGGAPPAPWRKTMVFAPAPHSR